MKLRALLSPRPPLVRPASTAWPHPALLAPATLTKAVTTTDKVYITLEWIMVRDLQSKRSVCRLGVLDICVVIVESR